jgi:hypothetical protein
VGTPEILLAAAIGLSVVVCGLSRARYSRQRLGSLEFLRTIEIDAPPEAVWEFYRRPENAVGIEEHCIEGHHVAGTPHDTIGECQTFTYDINGKRQTRTIEVVAFTPGHESTTVVIGGPNPLSRLRPRTTGQVAATSPNRTILTLIQGYTVSEAGLDRLPDEFLDWNLTWLDTSLQRIKQAIAATHQSEQA